MRILTDEKILSAINSGRKNKRDSRDGILEKASEEYMKDHRYAVKEQARETYKEIGEWVESRIIGEPPDNINDVVTVLITVRDIIRLKNGEIPE